MVGPAKSMKSFQIIVEIGQDDLLSKPLGWTSCVPLEHIAGNFKLLLIIVNAICVWNQVRVVSEPRGHFPCRFLMLHLIRLHEGCPDKQDPIHDITHWSIREG